MSLPIDAYLQPIAVAVSEHGCAVVSAAPGAGKTTRVPPALLRHTGIVAGKLLMLQPRRIAARAATARIALEQGWRVGKEVGYQVRFDHRITSDTRLVIMTEGILTCRLQSDPFLEDVGCVVLDEFHERSIHTDIALAMLQEVRTTVRPDLKIVVMSATLDADPISTFLDGAPVITVPGKFHAVEIIHHSVMNRERIAGAVVDAMKTIREAPNSTTGHILVFLPGMREIRQTQELISPGANDQVHILHSIVPAEEQDRAMKPTDKRKIILATNIAETSLTIDEVRTVIDAGFERVALQDSRLGIDRLEMRRISKASAIQRAGRAGRTSPGRCFRLWSEAEHGGLEERPVPEVHRTDLAATALALKLYGVSNLANFRWFEAPKTADIERAECLLYLLGATDSDGRLTEIGRRMGAIPTHPRLARLLLAGADLGILKAAAAVAARLSGGAYDARNARQSARHRGECDLLELDDNMDYGLRQRLAQIEEQFVRSIGTSVQQSRTTVKSETALRKALFLAYPDRLTVRRAQDASRGAMIGNRGMVLEPGSVVREARLFVSIDPSDVPTTHRPRFPGEHLAAESRVNLASAVEEEWLEELFPQWLEVKKEIVYDAERDRIIVLRRRLFSDLLIDERITGDKPRDIADGLNPIVKYLRENTERLEAFLQDRKETYDWLCRLQFAAIVLPELELPMPTLHWLMPPLEQAFFSAASLAGVKDANLLQAMKAALPHKLSIELERAAPRSFKAPSGSSVRIQYNPLRLEGISEAELSPPSASVRLQELFGLSESPLVAQGRVPIVLHLLSPGFRPVQVTSDLQSFWANTYAEVRKELRGRYLKHPWPEDPTKATAVAIGRRHR